MASIIYGKEGINNGSNVYGFGGLFSGSKIYESIIRAITESVTSFWGYSQVNGTSLSINSIGYIKSPIGQTAPFSISAYPNATVSGIRRQSGLPINVYEHVEYRWKLTYADDTNIEYFNDIWSQVDLAYKNPYTDIISPEFTAVIRKEGNYKLICEGRVMTSNGLVIIDTFEELFTINKNIQSHIYYDTVLGNDLNDGLDPNGFTLTNASYIESTRYLTEIGKFTSYNHATATSFGYDRENTNWIYVDGELRRIAAKISNDTIQLDTDYNLGINKVALTSSTGVKQNFDGLAVSNTNILLKGGTTTIINNTFSIITSGSVSLASYGALVKPTVTTNILTKLIYVQTNLSGIASPSFTISNIILDGNSMAYGIGGNLGSSIDTSFTSILLDRVETPNCLSSGSGINPIQASLNTKQLLLLIYGCLFNSLRVLNTSYTVSSAISGDAFLDVAEVIGGTTPASGTLRIWDGTQYDFHRYSSYAGSRFTLSGVLGLPATLQKTYIATSPVLSSEAKSNAVYIGYVGTNQHIRYIGNIVDAVCDSPIYEHFLYPNFASNHNHFAWNYGRSGDRVGYMFNTNNMGSAENNYVSIHDNYASQCEWFVDLSNGSNDPTTYTFANTSITRNKADNLSKGFNYSYTGKSIFAKGNEVWSTTFIADMFHNNSPLVPVTKADWDYVYEGNKCYGSGIGNQGNPVNGYELYGNESVDISTVASSISVSSTNITGLVVDSNTVYAPNDLDGSHLLVDGIYKNLTEFDNLIGGTNVEQHPDWQDGPNGDFSTALIPVNIVNLTNLKVLLNKVYNYDTSILFIGAPTITYSLGSGVLPNGLVLNSSTGIISGTATTLETVNGISITATNASGSATTAAVSMIVSDYTITFNNSSYGTITGGISNFISLDSGGFVQFDYTNSTPGNYPVVGPSNNIRFNAGSITIRHTYGTTTTFTIPNFQSLYLDGNKHTFKVTAGTGIAWNINIDGINYADDAATLGVVGNFIRITTIAGASTYQYAGRLYNLIVNDNTNQDVFIINSGSVTTENASSGNGIVTYTGVVASDWG